MVIEWRRAAAWRACTAAVLGAVLLGGCAGPVRRWIVQTRVHQGDAALARGSVHDAAISYQLALRIDPHDARARRGYVDAAAEFADLQYEQGQFEDALATLVRAAKYDPQNVRIQGLRATIEQAKLNREIVISNYPTYRLTGEQLGKSFAALDEQNKLVLKSLDRFNYTYDTQNLTKAILQAYDLQEDVTKNLNRLIAYRALVESGIPAENGAAQTSGGGSLLPLP